MPFTVHERLWPIKYVVFLGLFALSLGPMALAIRVAEVEPFKTAVVLKFDRAWPFVVYALVLLGVGLFVERAFCATSARSARRSPFRPRSVSSNG